MPSPGPYYNSSSSRTVVVTNEASETANATRITDENLKQSV